MGLSICIYMYNWLSVAHETDIHINMFLRHESTFIRNLKSYNGGST